MDLSTVFKSDRHERTFRAVVRCLRKIGYRGELIQEGYEFNDWFVPSNPKREVCAVFGQTPFSYDSACFSIFPTTTPAAASRVINYRALGAPLAFEVQEDAIVPWRVGRDAQTTSHFSGRIPCDAIDRVFQDQKSIWKPEAVLRAKNIGLPMGGRQLDLVDLGLIPALEEEISTKLHELLNEALADAQKVYRRQTGRQPDVRELFRLVFQLLAGRVLHDRGVAGFRNLPGAPCSSVILDKVGTYYGETLPILQNEAAQQAAFERLWTGFSFQNLSVDILAYVYENTLVDPKTRKEFGIHSTPRSIARYIVQRLPFEDIPENERTVVEPCSGHGIFLVTALKRLRDLLPPDMDGQERHRYFVKMLRGFELDEFALEVNRLCLTLADFPNHNGWRLDQQDVFNSNTFPRAIQQARIVLCNPPFEDFSKSAIGRQNGIVQKPVAVLKNVLDHLPANGRLGFVLPRHFISGKYYKEIRGLLGKRFSEIEIVALPDRIFSHAQLETCLLLGRVPKINETIINIAFSEVKDKDREKFLSKQIVSRNDKAGKTDAELRSSFAVLPLNEIWERLQNLPRLDEVAEIHRGVEWKQPFNEDKYLSVVAKAGFVRGVNSAEGRFLCFQKPKPGYLCNKSEFRRRHAWELNWTLPKIVMNAVRVSRGPWKIAAFVDETDTLYTTNFTCLWPKPPWSPKVLAAVLNSPIAAAFVAARETAKHIQKNTLKAFPIPHSFTPDVTKTIEGLVDDYLAAAKDDNASGLELWDTCGVELKAKRILLQIDAAVLQAYSLPPRLERQLLDYFRGEKRPVPFGFGDYFPADFTPTIPLWRYLSPDFANCNGRFLVETMPKITDPALALAIEEVV